MMRSWNDGEKKLICVTDLFSVWIFEAFAVWEQPVWGISEQFDCWETLNLRNLKIKTEKHNPPPVSFLVLTTRLLRSTTRFYTRPRFIFLLLFFFLIEYNIPFNYVKARWRSFLLDCNFQLNCFEDTKSW